MERVIALAVLSIGLSGFATEAVWNQNDSATRYWGTTAHWLVDGVVPTEPPTNNVNVTFPRVNGYQQQIIVGSSDSILYATPLNLGKMTGDTTHYILAGYRWDSGHGNERFPIVVQDPNDFYGFWGANVAQQRFFFPATDIFTPILHNFDIQGRPHLHFHGSGQAIVEAAYNDGAFVKTGEVEMVLKASTGASTLAYVTGGGLTLEGRTADDTIEKLLEGAYLHLDASDKTTLGFAEGSETSVTNWFDVRGRDYPFAHVPTPSDVSCGGAHPAYWEMPFVSTETSPTGLKLLDFGSCCLADEAPLFGPTNCAMCISRIENGSDIFVVGRYHDAEPFRRGAAFLGDIQWAPLQPYGGAIFGGSANKALREGYVSLNNKMVKSDFSPADGLTGLSVLTYGGSTDVALSLIASDQAYAVRTGGMLIGEILVYTNGLTQAERLRIADYLNRKWRTGETAVQSADAGAVLLYAPETSVGVSANKSAKIVDLVARTGKVIKTGTGALYADSLFPADAELDIRGGKVVVSPFLGSTVSTGVAKDPLVRFDASAPGTVNTVHNETYDKDFVTSWADCRQGVTAAAVPFSKLEVPRHPTVKSALTPTGLDVVDFGGNGSDNAGMTLPWYGTKTNNVYAGFIVMRQTSNGYSFVPFFGSEDFTFERERAVGHTSILGFNYSYPATFSALWTVNGTPLDPVEQRYDYFGSGAPFIVVSFSSRQPLNCSAISLGRGEPGRTGGIQVGEFILYDRPISYKEQRDTEAYLMNKWLGQSHPTLTTATPSYKFASDVDAIVETDADIPLPRITGSTGRLVKAGAGTLTGSANALIDVGIDKIVVEGGALNLTTAATDDGAYYHFDAMDIDSMTYTVDGAKTNVSVWADADGRDICATNTTLDYANGTPSIESVTFPDNNVRPGLFFGSPYVSTRVNGMWMNKTYVNKFREGISVFAVRGSDFRQGIFGNRSKDGEPYSGTAYQRGSDGSLTTPDHLETYSDWSVYELENDRVVTTDGSYLLYDTEPHIVGSRPSPPMTVDALCYQQVFGGGQTIFEQIGFTNQLSAARRDWWYRHLAYKWFGQGTDPIWADIALDELCVAADASVSLTGVGVIAVAKLAGAGSVSTEKTVSDIQNFETNVDDLLAGGAMTLDGVFLFAADTVVTLNDSVAGAKLKSGVGYVLMEGDCVADIDVSGWTVEAPASLAGREFSVTKIGNQIVLAVKGPGLMLIIR